MASRPIRPLQVPEGFWLREDVRDAHAPTHIGSRAAVQVRKAVPSGGCASQRWCRTDGIARVGRVMGLGSDNRAF